MAEAQKSSSPPGVDAITAFWRDVWARSAAGASAAGAGPIPGMPNIPGMGVGAGAMPDAAMFTPEAMRRMQSAFFDAMAGYAEQYMRSPQFLEAMKRSMDQAMQFRQQMDDFLKSNMATSFEAATGGANTEILAAIRHSAAQLQTLLSKMDERVSDLESAMTGKPKAAPTAAANAKKSAKR